HDAEWIKDDGWEKTPVTIDVPFHNRMRNPGLDSFVAGTFYHRKLISVIKEKIANSKDSRSFHYQPYKATWKPKVPGARQLELYGELYSSCAFREADKEVQALPTTPRNEGLERVVVAMMFWSDGTQLTSFGGSSLWPCYLFFGNESKYRRCRPSEHLGEQVAYFIKLSDTFNDYLQQRNNGRLPSDGLFTHCARELFQKQWTIMLDDELVDAMKNGLVLLCPDGRRRCFYPRVFTYSADYPEKTLIAGLRNNGGCPCHRCLVDKGDLGKLGAPTDNERDDQIRREDDQKELVDLARDEISSGFAVNGDRIDLHLKEKSLVPVHNAFSARLSQFGFKVADALVVDLMHEFEIGVWKRLFAHLIRLLEAFTGSNQPHRLGYPCPSRYRSTPSFGRDDIRRFGKNASEMARKAARDYEDLLQCAIPAFESLLPEPHNSSLQKLLFIYAQWHALAKLRQHHDVTLQLLDYTTTWLGAQTRLFNHQTCAKTNTKELRKESEARGKREGKGKGGGNSRKAVKFNIFTIKFHFLGDYTSYIRFFGTSDSFSTETGELFHRLPKSWFERTDRRAYEGQLSQIERRQARLAQIRDANAPASGGDLKTPGAGPKTQSSHSETKDAVDLAVVGKHQLAPTSPALRNFIPKLKAHIFPRIVGRLGYRDTKQFSEDDWLNVTFIDHRLYAHQLLYVNYTTYDVRRSQDIIHINTSHCNILLLDEEFSKDPLCCSIHPYGYAKALGVYHANVSYIGVLPDGTQDLTSHRIDFVWVHNYDFLEADTDFTLDRVSFQPLSSDDALGFVDPADILRGVHLIPQFSLKQLEPKPHKSKCFPSQEILWNAYYINRFADRDLFMRYQYGMSVGH
ncbi:hypothetical protein FA13DRAFT_1590392, partial [Coprinellus micaceus]